MKENNFSRLWISRIIESRILTHVKSPYISSFLFFGLPANLAFIAFYLCRNAYISPSFLYSYIFALVWLNLGPTLIWYYDERLLPEFFCRAEELLSEPELHIYLAQKYDRLFSKRFWIFTIPWTLLLIGVFIAANSILSKAGLFGIQDPWYWAIIALVIWMAHLTSIGFWGVYITIRAIHEISNQKLNVDPLHTDKLGGLSCVGYYSIGTTILFSSGSLFIPVAFQVVSVGEKTLLFVYSAVILYSLFILLSFVYPTIRIHNKAKEIRDSILDHLRLQHKQLTQSIKSSSDDHTSKIECYHELARIRSEYEDYSNVKLYPYETEIVVKLISSVLLPFIFIMIQYYWFS